MHSTAVKLGMRARVDLTTNQLGLMWVWVQRDYSFYFSSQFTDLKMLDVALESSGAKIALASSYDERFPPENIIDGWEIVWFYFVANALLSLETNTKFPISRWKFVLKRQLFKNLHLSLY